MRKSNGWKNYTPYCPCLLDNCMLCVRPFFPETYNAEKGSICDDDDKTDLEEAQ